MSIPREVELAARTATEASAQLAVERKQAREVAVQVIRAIEHRIKVALAGDVLRGLPDLTPGLRLPLLGLRVVATTTAGMSEPIGDRNNLVLDKRGVLMVVRRAESGFGGTVAQDDVFKAEDLPAFARCAQVALEGHAARANRSKANYKSIRELADALAGAIGYAFK